MKSTIVARKMDLTSGMRDYVEKNKKYTVKTEFQERRVMKDA